MSGLHLISYEMCPYVQRAVIILLEKNIAFKRSNVDLANKPDWFLKISPLGRVPLLQVKDTILFESQVIAEYLDEITDDSLHPVDPLERAKHRSWIEFASGLLITIYQIYNTKDKAIFDEKCDELRRKFKLIEAEIKGPYFAGKEFYMVDAIWATLLRYFNVLGEVASLNDIANIGKVEKWRQVILSRESVKNSAPADFNEQFRKRIHDGDSYLSKLMG